VNLFCVISLIVAIWSTPASAKPLAPVMRTSHFVVHYDSGDPFLVKLMAEAAEDELSRVSRDLGMRSDPKRPFSLYVYSTHMGFIRAGGLETRKFTVGTARSGSEAISVDASGAFALPQQVLAHEITHAVIFRILGARVHALPLWMNEGLAEYESGGKPARDELETVAEAAASGTLIRLEHLSRQFPEKRTALAYAQSASAVRYMIREHGKHSPKVLLSELAATGSFDRAMLMATGRTASRFEQDWLAESTREYWALRATRIGAAVLSVIMAILTIAAFLARRRAKIEAARRWEEEETLRRLLGSPWDE